MTRLSSGIFEFWQIGIHACPANKLDPCKMSRVFRIGLCLKNNVLLYPWVYKILGVSFAMFCTFLFEGPFYYRCLLLYAFVSSRLASSCLVSSRLVSFRFVSFCLVLFRFLSLSRIVSLCFTCLDLFRFLSLVVAFFVVVVVVLYSVLSWRRGRCRRWKGQWMPSTGSWKQLPLSSPRSRRAPFTAFFSLYTLPPRDS